MIHFNSLRITSDNRGYTVVEMVVVTAIIAIISVALLRNLSRTRTDLNQGVNQVTAALRSAQVNAVSSTRYGNYIPCGYGFHYIDTTHFSIYVGPDAAGGCNANKKYQIGQDILGGTQTFQDSRIRFQGSFKDIFFEPPDPKTYFDNNSSLNQQPQQLVIMKTGGSCPQDCKTIYVYPSGKIEVQ